MVSNVLLSAKDISAEEFQLCRSHFDLYTLGFGWQEL